MLLLRRMQELILTRVVQEVQEVGVLIPLDAKIVELTLQFSLSTVLWRAARVNDCLLAKNSQF